MTAEERRRQLEAVADQRLQAWRRETNPEWQALASQLEGLADGRTEAVRHLLPPSVPTGPVTDPHAAWESVWDQVERILAGRARESRRR